LEIVSDLLPDLILLDVTMPEMTGFEVIEVLKRNNKTKHIPVIFLTARTEIESMIKGFKLGAADYVTKPFNNQELLARVRAHVEIKLSRDLIDKQNNELKDLNSTKDKFFSIIAHDLKNPFAALISSSEVLQMFLSGGNYEKATAKAEAILSASEKGFTLLSNLLEWAQCQLGTVTILQVKQPVKLLINNVLQVLNIQASNKQIKIIDQTTNELMLAVDADLFKFIFRNLITNAIKYTPVGGKITISVVEKGNTVIFSVTDTGVGIPKEKLDKLFRIDSKTSAPGTNGETGTGLGLILCKEFVTKHNGEIWAENNTGNGCSFKFSIPK